MYRSYQIISLCSALCHRETPMWLFVPIGHILSSETSTGNRQANEEGPDASFSASSNNVLIGTGCSWLRSLHQCHGGHTTLWRWFAIEVPPPIQTMTVSRWHQAPYGVL